jgi:hypothetical protein
LDNISGVAFEEAVSKREWWRALYRRVVCIVQLAIWEYCDISSRTNAHQRWNQGFELLGARFFIQVNLKVFETDNVECRSEE